jgi:hypothetical protein
MKFIQPPKPDCIIEATEEDARYLVEMQEGYIIPYNDKFVARMKGVWILFILPDKNLDNSTLNETESDPFGIHRIKWYVGGGENKRKASPEDGFAWTFIYDTEGNVHPENLPTFT